MYSTLKRVLELLGVFLWDGNRACLEAIQLIDDFERSQEGKNQ